VLIHSLVSFIISMLHTGIFLIYHRCYGGGNFKKTNGKCFKNPRHLYFGVQVTSKDERYKRFTSYIRVVYEVTSFILKADDGNQYEFFSKKPLSHDVDLSRVYLKTCHQIVCAVGKDCGNALCQVS